jgi:hypothetical protein
MFTKNPGFSILYKIFSIISLFSGGTFPMLNSKGGGGGEEKGVQVISLKRCYK